ncbi:D-2-hydroxyacid dehydrogenase [Actinocatenispora rupis]|uniref:D-2-hydroxyacid dehydrogenase n=1 Tax=Actinocatenispora rupis TaxID=519421 RepID=UPI0019408F9B|nr:D-2-hydroxyacid dehydrogenase [Actinocatenispora rupis]
MYADDRPSGLAAFDGRARFVLVTEDELPAALKDADALLVWDFRSRAVPAAWPVDGPHPRWVHVAAAGVDTVLCPALREGGVTVTNSRGVFDTPIAEYVTGLVLAMAKGMPDTLAAQRERRWAYRETESVAGRSALVVGTGPIGRAIARMLTAVGLRVTGVGRTERASDADFGTVHGFPALPGLLGDADYVVLAAPLTEQTTGMIDAAALAAMRPGARLVNIGRGPLVVTADLVAALTAGRIAGAALDVFDTEPLPPDSPLWTVPGLVVSPHMSGDTLGWRDDLAALFADNLDRWLADQPLRNVVDLRLGYVPTG